MKIWFCSDHHFGHRNIIKFCDRPFADSVEGVSHMNWSMVNNHNMVVSGNDEVYFIGDVAMGDTAQSLKYINHMNGKKYLVPGNHDKCFGSKSTEQKRKLYEDVGFTILPEHVKEFDLLGTLVDLCHFPYSGDHTENDRYVNQRPVDEGRYLLQGHIHEKYLKNGRNINVGVDAWKGFPASAEEILYLIQYGDEYMGIRKWEL